MTAVKNRGSQLTQNLQYGPANFKIDSGADTSVMPEASWLKLNPRPKLKDVTMRLTSPEGPFTLIGSVHCTHPTQCQVVQFPSDRHQGSTSDNLQSHTTAVNLGFIKRVDHVIGNDLFGDLVLVDCNPVTIKIKDDAQPYCVTTARADSSSRSCWGAEENGSSRCHHQNHRTNPVVFTNGTTVQDGCRR